MEVEPLLYLNGEFRSQREAHLALNDAGFTLGVTVTDLCRTFHHRLFRLDDHLQRFRQSCNLAHVPQRCTNAELADIAERLVAHNAALLKPGDDLALVLFATPGPLGYSVSPRQPTLGMYTYPLLFARDVHLFRNGARLLTPSIRHVPPACVDPRIKQRNRLVWWLAEHEVEAKAPGAAALLLDETGCVTETATANFLIVRDGVVLSPPRSSVLNGISLLVTEEICHDLGIPFREQPLPLRECHSADEALLTSTPYGLAGVRELNGLTLPWPGPVCRRLLNAWKERAGLDIEQQFVSHVAK